MAQDQRNQQQPGGQPRPGVISPASPFYSKDNLPKGEIDPDALWLFDRGWKSLGNPSWETAKWFDPARPLKTEKHEVPCFGYVERLDHNDRDASGKPKLKIVHEQLYDQDGTPQGNRRIPITQTVIVPPASAMTRQEAILVQLDRERRQVEEQQKKVG